MIQFNTTIQKFNQQGEKTGWTYIEISAEQAQLLKPHYKKSFRVKGKIDAIDVTAIALIPMGEGKYILPLNNTIRKLLQKRKNDSVCVSIEEDKIGYVLNESLIECLQDEPTALAFFNTLTKGHQNYFSKWIDAAKTIETQTKRIAMIIHALNNHWDYGNMIRNNAKNK